MAPQQDGTTTTAQGTKTFVAPEDPTTATSSEDATAATSDADINPLETVTRTSDVTLITATVLAPDSIGGATTLTPDPSELGNSSTSSASLSQLGDVLVTTTYLSTSTIFFTTNRTIATQTNASTSNAPGSTDTLASLSTATSTDGSAGSSTTNGPESPESSSSGSSGLSTGAKAGIAIGVVAVVAIIAGFFLWKFCFAKKRSNRRGDAGLPAPFAQQRLNSSPGASGATSLEKTATPVVGALAAVNSRRGRNQAPTPESETLLPQQADDATVQSRFATVYDQIELHAENFYKDASPMIPPTVEGALSRYDTPLLGAPLAARLEESPRATTILKHVLSYEVSTTVVSPSPNDRKRSLLPPPLLALLQEAHSQKQPHQSGRRGLASSAYTRLKQLAASYRSSPQSMPSTTNATRDSAAHFSQVFSLWADPQYDESRRTQHLAEVLDQAVKFSVWLLSQPETFELRWDGSAATVDKEATGVGAGEHSLITVPALVKISSNGGHRLSPGDEKVLSKAIYRRI